MYVTLQNLSDWCLYCIYVWQKFWRKKITNWLIIWIKFKVFWLLLVLCSALTSSGPQLQRQLDTIIWTLELLWAFSLHFLLNIFKYSFIHAFSTAMLLQAVSSMAFTSTSIRSQACPFFSAPEINVKCTLSFIFSTLSLCGQSLIRCLVLLHSKHIIIDPSAFFGLPSTLLNSCCYYL